MIQVTVVGLDVHADSIVAAILPPRANPRGREGLWESYRTPSQRARDELIRVPAEIQHVVFSPWVPRRGVAMLVNGTEASGYHEVKFD